MLSLMKMHFLFLPSSSDPTHTYHASSRVSIDWFADIAHSPALLPNHGVGTGRGARLELLEDLAPLGVDSAIASHVD
jgi:hypothetical protein